MKVILITGASSGIGYQAAELLARKGYKVYGAARRVEKIEPLASLGVVPVRMDLTDEASVRECVEGIIAAEGRIDVLVNDAGYGYFGSVEDVSIEEARRQLEVNVFALARLIQLVLPSMREHRSGRIINVASVAGRAVLPYGGWYCVSKYAVEALSDSLRMELKPFGIKVSVIEPGGIKTDWGPIAADHLSECSAGGAYAKEAAKEARLIRYGYGSNLMTKPVRVARTIARAATSRHPRVRYRVGLASRSIVFFHAILPARCWDALLRGLMV